MPSPPDACEAAAGRRRDAASLRVGGMTALTTIDFPGRLAAVVFCQGCPWRCGYCHNPGLLDARAPSSIAWADVLAFLQARQGLLDGVVFSGGEPTLQGALAGAIADVQARGFEVALHTAGMYPDRLPAILPQLDWIGLDLKAPLHRYDAITRVPGSGERAWESLRHWVASDVAGECRTTWHAGMFDIAELHALAESIAALGVKHWALQECRGSGASASLGRDDISRLAARFSSFTLRKA
ncbi:anaerobic ribonucleoside-triphosphate reductase activating protein (plasmid) [Cupriavidus necator H16]|uniref:Activase of anaerobic class III ribonucleotide reductase n=2 Tax=Cupriavidus necator TaxID=106590 RepID=Q7WX99_CUPNH|nr:anaerobic ribonucleoside-triphosphate reductase activating protein [Cupriavidus necator]AAP85990.1 activase of anaerobic class III ribonucleotide reductase [Cupriavidus necator H16]QCC05476.1 anaerobic ribonucleoside-triphosphate reductase activating protein [Cupriavidus necator H16]